MNPPTQDIKDILLESSSGLSLVFATDLFISKMPETPDACACLYDTPGFAPNPNYEYDYPGIQARIRGARMGYLTGWALAKDIRDVLNGLTNYTINSTRYIEITCQSDIMFIYYDDLERPYFSVNFEIHRATA